MTKGCISFATMQLSNVYLESVAQKQTIEILESMEFKDSNNSKDYKRTLRNQWNQLNPKDSTDSTYELTFKQIFNLNS